MRLPCLHIIAFFNIIIANGMEMPQVSDDPDKVSFSQVIEVWPKLKNLKASPLISNWGYETIKKSLVIDGQEFEISSLAFESLALPAEKNPLAFDQPSLTQLGFEKDKTSPVNTKSNLKLGDYLNSIEKDLVLNPMGVVNQGYGPFWFLCLKPNPKNNIFFMVTMKREPKESDWNTYPPIKDYPITPTSPPDRHFALKELLEAFPSLADLKPSWRTPACQGEIARLTNLAYQLVYVVFTDPLKNLPEETTLKSYLAQQDLFEAETFTLEQILTRRTEVFYQKANKDSKNVVVYINIRNVENVLNKLKKLEE